MTGPLQLGRALNERCGAIIVSHVESIMVMFFWQDIAHFMRFPIFNFREIDLVVRAPCTWLTNLSWFFLPFYLYGTSTKLRSTVIVCMYFDIYFGVILTGAILTYVSKIRAILTGYQFYTFCTKKQFSAYARIYLNSIFRTYVETQPFSIASERHWSTKK